MKARIYRQFGIDRAENKERITRQPIYMRSSWKRMDLMEMFRFNEGRNVLENFYDIPMIRDNLYLRTPKQHKQKKHYVLIYG